MASRYRFDKQSLKRIAQDQSSAVFALGGKYGKVPLMNEVIIEKSPPADAKKIKEELLLF
jgi:hypothetical protein